MPNNRHKSSSATTFSTLWWPKCTSLPDIYCAVSVCLCPRLGDGHSLTSRRLTLRVGFVGKMRSLIYLWSVTPKVLAIVEWFLLVNMVQFSIFDYEEVVIAGSDVSMSEIFVLFVCMFCIGIFGWLRLS